MDRVSGESMDQPVQITAQCMPVVNFALQQNDVPVFREVAVTNGSAEALTDLVVDIEVSGDLAHKWELRVARIAAGETVRLRGIDLRLDPGRLANQVEREQAEAVVTVRSGGRELGRLAQSISVLAFNEWPGTSVLQEILAAFVTPNHPAIETLMGTVREILGQQTGDPSLAGYQTGGRARAAQIVGAVYAAMRKVGIGYINPPASYENTGQKIRTPAEVLEGSRLGTCLDLVVVAAAAMEQAGLSPLLLLVEGHAFVGAWLQDDQFSEPAVDDVSRIANRVRLQEIITFEATSLCDGKGLEFASAESLSHDRLKQPEKFLVAIDVKAARRAGIRPLPARVRQGDGFVVIQRVEATDEQAKTIPGSGGLQATAPRKARTKERKLPANLPPEAVERLEVWKRKLLDLSLRNPLLNFRTTTKKVVPLLASDIALLAGRLSGGPLKLARRSGVHDPEGPRDLKLERERSGRDIPAEMLLQELDRGLIRADLGEEFDKIVVELFRAARLALEETGTNTLFLALGTLHWYESGSSQQQRVSPLVLVPVRLERGGPGKFSVVASDEDTRVNITLLEKLARDFEIDPQIVYDVCDDEAGFDVRTALDAFTTLVKDLPRCEVRDSAHLGLFSFSKYLLYADLDERLEQVVASQVVRQILDRSSRANDDGPFPTEQELDSATDPLSTICPVDADSSQAAAVRAAMQGKSFVLQGPPGTGKSQTITNLIARAAFEGKRVLFVAEKQAALEVVQRRLRQAGLGPYVLEVHSGKAGKKEVLNQLQVALNSVAKLNPDAWEEEANRLHRLRDELNSYVTALHTLRPSGDTIFRAISRLSGLASSPKVSLVLPRPGEMTKERLAHLREAIATAAVAAGGAGGVANHPLRGVRVTTWRVDLADQVASAIDEVRGALDEFATALDQWLRAMGLTTPATALTSAEVKPLLAVAKLAQPQRWSARVLLTEPGWESLKSEIFSLVRQGRERDAARADLLQRYSASYLALDHGALAAAFARASQAFVLIRWFKKRQAVAPIRATLKEGRLPDDATLSADLAKGTLVRERSAALRRTDTPAARALGSLLHDGEADWIAVEAAVASAGELRKLLATYPAAGAITPEQFKTAVVDLLDADGFKLEPGSAARMAAEAFLSASGKVHAALPALQSLLEVSDSTLFGKPEDAFLVAMRQTLDRWYPALGRLAEWAAWQRAFRREDVPELRPVIDAIDAGRLHHGDAVNAFEAAYARAWLGAVMPTEPSLREFTHENRHRQILEFGRADKAVQELSRQVIAARLAAQVPRATAGMVPPNSEAGILRRQLQLQRNHKPVRKLVRELPTLLPKLKPVWLMSPLSVATYLDPSVPPFDLVVFDEASQIPVWDAVGAVARGSRAVVVGDSKQLPPTDFFQKQSGGEGPADDDADVEELESILDECKASDLPELTLKWHYRSRHESLIAFSNAHYYDGSLLTFPSADDRPERLGVSMRYIAHARYDRGGSRTNRAEAEAIVEELCARAAAGDTRTVGIVTFSTAQRTLIEDLFDERVRSNPELQQCYRSGEEQLFIKNLENVQGDERDVILFSICYGPDEAGKVSLGFGPLNREGGERRLNVAITRARQQVIVFTSLRADQIDLNRSRSKGLTHLRNFLDYAQRGPKALAEVITPGGQDDWESPFEMAVCKELRDRGFVVETQVGCSAYRIDLAIRDPERPGRYLIGIECDGASYHSAKTARDRDRLRQQVLEQLGWTLHRVWSTDWLQNREMCVERMLAAIEGARLKAAAAAALPAEPPRTPVGPASVGRPTERVDPLEDAQAASALDDETQATDAESDDEDPEITRETRFAFNISASAAALPSARPYVEHEFERAPRGPEVFYLRSSARQISQDLSELVRLEGPIHRVRAYGRVAREWGLQRVTSRVTDRLDGCARLVRDTVIGRGEFLWPAVLHRGSLGFFRTAADGRESPRAIVEIAPEELAVAIVDVLKAHFGMPASELDRQIVSLFGCRRVTVGVRAHIASAVDLLISDGQCIRDTDRIRLRI